MTKQKVTQPNIKIIIIFLQCCQNATDAMAGNNWQKLQIK